MEPEDNEYLVTFTYKGHSDSIVIEATEETLESVLKKKKIKVIDEIYPPGTWHYDKETEVATPGEE